jgi:hypothetical protein
MTWYAVSIVSTIVMPTRQEKYPVFEDFYLFSAESEAELQRKITRRMEIIDLAGSCTYEGTPATQKCLGVRKIRSVYNDDDENRSVDESPPTDGTELTHSFYFVSSLEDAKRLAQGSRVWVEYVDDDSAL